MRHHAILLIILFAVSFFVVACNDSYIVEEAVDADVLELKQTSSWQEAYMLLLLTCEHSNADSYFLIHDFDMDGTPELIIFELAERELWGPFHLNAIAAYAFRGGSLMNIDFADIPSNASGFRASLDPSHGILAYIFGNESNAFTNSYVRLIMEGDRIIAAEDEPDWWIGWHNITRATTETNVYDAINNWQPGTRVHPTHAYYDTPISTFQITEEIEINIAHVMDEHFRNEFLSEFDSFALFCEHGVDASNIDKYYNFASDLGLIAFTTNVPLYNFRYIEINGAEIQFFAEETLYLLDVILPEEPLLVNWSARGSMPHRGISFVYGNITRYFVFHYDARGYEAFLLWEFPILRAWSWGEEENEITFMPNSALRDFKVFDMTNYEVIQIIDEVSPDKLFVTTWSQQGYMPNMGISFIDKNNIRQYFYLDMKQKPEFASDGDFLLERLVR